MKKYKSRQMQSIVGSKYRSSQSDQAQGATSAISENILIFTDHQQVTYHTVYLHVYRLETLPTTLTSL